MELSSGQVIDRYTVDGTLGEGGMAVVYAVHHNTLETRHALKVLTLRSSGIKERLLAEGRIQASLRHPNVVAVSDVLELGGAPALLMELVEGPSLDDLIRRQGALPLAVADQFARGILAGVAAAHARGMVHRDLKPANVLLAVSAEGIVPKVADFGLARLGEVGGGKTRTGTTMGTPQYMAPEQIRDAKSVGPEADVFSLGAILYEMVTGVRAFDGEDLFAIFQAVDEGRYVPPAERRADLPARMIAAIEGALTPDRTRRTKSVTDLLAVWEGDVARPGSIDAAVVAVARSLAAARTLPRSGVSSDTWDGTRPEREPTTTSSSSVSALMWGVGGGAVLAMGAGALVVAVVAVGAAWWWWPGRETVAGEPGSTEGGAEVVAVPAVVAAPIEAGGEPGTAEPASVVAPPPRAVTPGVAPSEASAVPNAPAAVPSAEPAVVPTLPPQAEAAPAAPTAIAAPASVAAAPEPAAELPPPGDPRATLPPALRSQSVAVRSGHLITIALDAGVARILQIVVMTDPASEVRTRAFRLSMEQWRRGIGDLSVHEGTASWVAQHGSSAAGRIEALTAMSRSARRVASLTPALADKDATVRAAAAGAVGVVTTRTGDASGTAALEDALATEADPAAAAAMRSALGR